MAESRLGSGDERAGALVDLRRRWKDLSDQAKKPGDAAERRLARQVLGGLSTSLSRTDADYLKIIAEYRMGRGER